MASHLVQVLHFVRAKILIADDQKEVLNVLRRGLEATTSLVVCGEALNGAEAVVKAAELHPDLVIL